MSCPFSHPLRWAVIAIGLLCPVSAVPQAIHYGASSGAIQALGLDWLHARGYTGRGVRIAVFDAGFRGADSSLTFAPLRSELRLAFAYDVFAGNANPFDDNVHGHYVLSVLATRDPGFFVGAAPDATYLLLRTESDAAETHAEEIAWGRAVDTAIARGAQLIVSALGYSTFDPGQGSYTYADLDGATTLVALAANRAAAAGLLVINSAGNEAQSAWHYITSPCDAPGVLCVGARDEFGAAGDFTSFGPTPDGRPKPEVSALGAPSPVVDPGHVIRWLNGTSYAAPWVAGLVACLSQAHPWASAAQLREAVLRSADHFPTADLRLGYGVPNARRADAWLRALRGLPPLEGATLSVFPNPASTSVTLRWESTEAPDPALCYLISVSGQILHTFSLKPEQPTDLSVAHLPQGLYVFHIPQANLWQRFVVLR